MPEPSEPAATTASAHREWRGACSSTKRLFSFFPDEISFQPSEFAGLTEEEAHSLFQRKDTTYLRS